MNSNVYIDIAESVTRSQRSLCALIKGMDCHSDVSALYIQLLGNLWMIYDSLENRIQNGNASRSFLIPCKAGELVDSLIIIPNLAEMLLSGAGEK